MVRVDVRVLATHLAGLAWVAVRSFVGTVTVLILEGIVLATASWYVLGQYWWVYGLMAAFVALVEAVVTGIFLGAKRALVMTFAHGLGKLRLGEMLLRLVFDRMIGIASTEAVGERGGRLVQVIERLPLAKADERLRKVIQDLTGEAGQGSWLRRKIQSRLLDAVSKYTLARFRDEDAERGGVDLIKVKDEIEQNADDAIVRKVRGGVRTLTLAVILGLPFVVALQTWLAVLLIDAFG
ncbi:MAG: hypothetical protein HY289_03070 [Planctomycetes bacterium]|nr:hypothetical protein [Planctomycetota bacterium]